MAWCRGRARTICINDAYRLAPWADVLYAGDARWWLYHWERGASDFGGLRYAMQADAAECPGVEVLRHTGERGMEREPTGLRSGRNSGYAAINLAVHLGARRILLLGYDMQASDPRHTHFFGNHPKELKALTPYPTLVDYFASAVEPLRQLGIEILNCSRETALACFPRMALREALAQAVSE